MKHLVFEGASKRDAYDVLTIFGYLNHLPVHSWPIWLHGLTMPSTLPLILLQDLHAWCDPEAIGPPLVPPLVGLFLSLLGLLYVGNHLMQDS